MASKKKPAAKSAKKPAAMKPVIAGVVEVGARQPYRDAYGRRHEERARGSRSAGTDHARRDQQEGRGIVHDAGAVQDLGTAVAAKPKRKGIDPFTKEERWFAAKPASVKVKIRPLKKLKDSAL